MDIWPKNTSGNHDFAWGESVSGAQYDAHHILTHEFGHATNRKHPDENGIPDTTFASVMKSVSTLGEARRRNLYQIDRRCSENFQRGFPQRIRRVSSGWDPPVGIFTDEFKAHAVAGNGKVGSVIGPSFLMTSGSTGSLRASSSGASQPISGVLVTASFAFGASELARLREVDLYGLRASWVSRYHDQTGSASSTSRVTSTWSTDGFTTKFPADLAVCTSMFGLYGCLATTPMVSAYPPATAALFGNYYEAENAVLSVTVWAKQDRSVYTDGAIQIAPGVVNSSVLPTPTQIAWRSRVGPGVVCMEDSALTFPCGVFFVEPSDPDFKVKVKRFDVRETVSSGRHALAVESGLPTNVGTAATAQRIAAFFDTAAGKYVVVTRAISEANQPLRAYSSADLLSWSDDGAIGQSLTGPSVSSYIRATTNEVFGVYPSIWP
jgi:hypothetical protein